MRRASKAHRPHGWPGRRGVRLEAVAGDEVVRRVGAVAGAPGDGDLVGDVGDLDPHQEPHPVEEPDECGGLAGLGVGGERLAVVDPGERVLDVALRREDQGLGPDTRGEALEVLGGQRVQPREPVGPADAHHVAVREVDEAVGGLERALLAVEGAVVRRHTGVDAVAADRPGETEQGTGHGHSGHLGALDAGAEHGQVTHVDGEVLLVAQAFGQGREHAWSNRDDAPTIPADQVEVLVVADGVVGRRPVAEVGVPHQPEPFEHLEGPVDGRGVDRRRVLADLGEHLVGGGVAELLHRGQDQLALGGQPVAAVPEPAAEVVHVAAPAPAPRWSWAQVCGWSS